MPGEFTERWTTAAAREIAKMIEQEITAEREACAQIAEQYTGGREIAAAIRRRGENGGSSALPLV